MTSSNIFWSFGFLYWMASAIPVLYAQKCEAGILSAIKNCNCSISDKQTIVLENCLNAIVNLPGLYNASNSKSLITVRDSTSVTLVNKWKDVPGNNTSKEMREVYLMMNNVEKVTIKPNTFDQLVINAVFREIKELELSDKSFLSCWGSVWLFNVVVPNNSLNSNAFSSSDLVVHNGVSFTVNARPKVTPRLKFSQIYEVSAKVYDLEITIYAVLALIGAVILTLICLTIVVARKFASPSSRSENLPDVIQILTPVQSRRNKNPVTKVSRLSKAVFPNRGANKEPQRAKANNPKQRSRPPLPPPHYDV